MKKFKNYFYTILKILFTFIIIGTLSYFNIISEKSKNIIKIILGLIIIFIEAYKIGKKTKKRGYIEGLLFGTALSIIFLILHILINKKISIYMLFKYIIIITTSSLGSMFGKNKKIKD